MKPYYDFLERRRQLGSMDGFAPVWMPAFLFDFQAALVEWALAKGRAAIFADCGLGKTPMQLVWAENVHRHTGRPVLIVTPLAVSFQTEVEAAKFGIEAAVSRLGNVTAAITITNYDRLHLFNSEDYAGLVCDESSAIKAFDGVRRALVTDFSRKMPYRLLCTATAAPNDYVELGTSSEALGELGYMDMLSRFFVNDQHSSNPQRRREKFTVASGDWRFKGHAEESFWRWVSSWARAMRRPSDLGFSDELFSLPALKVREHIVEARRTRPGMLFDLPAVNLREQREEESRTVTERCEAVASLLKDVPSGIAWCQRNSESELLTRLLPGAVEIRGSDEADAKEEALLAFSRGQVPLLVTKPSIAGWGLNWQHCHNMTFFPSHSYEQYYQSVRRCWRFGQLEPVVVDIVSTKGGAEVLKNLQRKSDQADRMFTSLVGHMQDGLAIRRRTDYDVEEEIPVWLS